MPTLSNLLRSDPDNPHLRLLLAQRQIAHGEVTHARRTLARPGVQRPRTAPPGLWTQWELALYEYNHLPASADQRQAQSQAIRQQIQELAQIPWPAGTGPPPGHLGQPVPGKHAGTGAVHHAGPEAIRSR